MAFTWEGGEPGPGPQDPQLTVKSSQDRHPVQHIQVLSQGAVVLLVDTQRHNNQVLLQARARPLLGIASAGSVVLGSLSRTMKDKLLMLFKLLGSRDICYSLPSRLANYTSGSKR